MSRHKSIVGKLAGMLVDCVPPKADGKGGLTMSKKMLVGLCVMVFGSAIFAETQNVTLNVSPGGLGWAISATPSTVEFGQVDVNTSSAPEQGVLITNTGTGPLKLTKTVTSDDSWTLAESTGVVNECVVWCLDAETYPDIDGFGDFGNYGVAHSSFTTVTGVESLLKNAGGTQTTLEVGKGATTWYRIDIPNTVGGGGTVAQAIVVRFTSSAQ